jgi:hypothetical protein
LAQEIGGGEQQLLPVVYELANRPHGGGKAKHTGEYEWKAVVVKEYMEGGAWGVTECMGLWKRWYGSYREKAVASTAAGCCTEMPEAEKRGGEEDRELQIASAALLKGHLQSRSVHEWQAFSCPWCKAATRLVP